MICWRLRRTSLKQCSRTWKGALNKVAKRYEFYVGGPRDGQGLAAWARDMQAKQKAVKSEVRSVARKSVAAIVQEARLDARGKIQKAAVSSVRAEFFKGAPAVKAGGRKQVIAARKNKRPVMGGEIIIGAEFGGYKRRTRPRGGRMPWTGSAWQFRPRTPKRGRGNEGNFLYPAIRKHYKAIVEKYQDSLDKIFSK